MAGARIVVDPTICGGKPTIKGARIMAKNILGMVAGGYTVERIVKEYPELTPEDVSAVLKICKRCHRRRAAVAVSDVRGALVIIDRNKIRMRRYP